jgi:hypothetical protein
MSATAYKDSPGYRQAIAALEAARAAEPKAPVLNTKPEFGDRAELAAMIKRMEALWESEPKFGPILEHLVTALELLNELELDKEGQSR